MWVVGGENHADKVFAMIGQISALCVRFSATNLRRGTIKAYPFALSLSKPVLSLPKEVSG